MEDETWLSRRLATEQWRELTSSAPEVVPSSQKQIAEDDGKEMVTGQGLEVAAQENFPEAVDDDGGKEVVHRRIFPALPEPPVRWLKEHPRTRWSLVITALLIVVAAGLGAGLGVALQNSSSKTGSGPVVTVSTSLYDASPIPSPTNSAPPTGTFALALGAPQETQDTCLPEIAQKAAWDCELGPNSELGLFVGESQPGLGASHASMHYASDDGSVVYGSQAANMNTSFVQLLTVQDNDDPGYGPAYYFQQVYDKVVVVREASMSTASIKDKRVPEEMGTPLLQKREVAQPGEKPWFCVWNSTFLELFIYIQEAAQDPTSTLESTAPATTGSNLVTTSAQPTAAQFAHTDLWSQMSRFPYLVKIEERRVRTDNISPYCQQYQILDGGLANWIADRNGNPVTVELNEQDPDYTTESDSVASTSKTKYKRSVAGGCHCQWMSGQ